MKDSPFTDLQARLLDALEEAGATSYTTALPPAHIASLMGLHQGPKRVRGPWSGTQNPAQYIIAPLSSLRTRGLVAMAPRPDGLSGTAYYITSAGLESE